MADISITQPHAMTMESARTAAQGVADKLIAEFGITYRWEQNTLVFQRAGVEGALTLRANEAQLELELGLMLKGFSSMIEEKLMRKMKSAFAA